LQDKARDSFVYLMAIRFELHEQRERISKELCEQKVHCWIGSVQGAVATWSVIGMQYWRRILDSDGWTRSLPLPVLTRAKCKPDSVGVCDSEVDYVVIKPDGNVYAERKGQTLWKEQAPPAQNIQLSKAILGIRIEPDDPAGEYKVKAKVSDLNADITLELETKFRVQ
jgi:hypothetical protein